MALALSVPEPPASGPRVPDLELLDGSRLQPECDVIRAQGQSELQAAMRLLQSLYASRGYAVSGLDPDPDLDIILVAAQDGEVMGTLTLRFDSLLGLRADDTYGYEIDLIRAEGRRACELGRFAVARSAHSKTVIGALFGRACEIVRERDEVTDVFIEVNPRHVPFYRRAFGFSVAAAERTCPRVRAPSVLLRLEVAAFAAGRGSAASERFGDVFARGLAPD